MSAQQFLTAVSPSLPKTKQRHLLGAVSRESIMTTEISPTIIDENNLLKNKNTTVVLRNNAKNVSLPTALMEHFLNDEVTSVSRQSAPPQTLNIPFTSSLQHLKNDSDIPAQIFCRQNLLLQHRDFCSQFFDSAKTPELSSPIEPKESGPSHILDFMYLGSLEDALNFNILKVFFYILNLTLKRLFYKLNTIYIKLL